MSIQIKLKNSVVQDSTPSTSDLPAVGEIALNANINSIGGFMRASNNTIVKIFGPGSVSTPTATTTVSGIAELATSSETTTGTATNRVVTPAGLNAVTVAERSTSNSTYLALAGGTLTGVVAATAGSNSAPSIHFGDSDSGIFGGTNTVSLAAGGTTRLTADAGVSVVGTLAVTGAITSTSDLTIAEKIIHSGDTDTFFSFPGDDIAAIDTGGSERLRVDGSGRVLYGKTSNRQTRLGVNSFSPNIQIEDQDIGVMSATRFKDNDAPFRFILQKGRGTIASPAAVLDNDKIGQILFSAHDGSNFCNLASIVSEVDGTPGTDDMPGNLIFSTTADGANAVTERFRIDSAGLSTFTGSINTNGDLNIGNNTSANPFTKLTFGASQFGSAEIRPTNDASHKVGLSFYTDGTQDTTINPTERLRITSAGNVGIGTVSPSTIFEVQTAASERIQFLSNGSNEQPRIDLIRDSGTDYSIINAIAAYEIRKGSNLIYTYANDTHRFGIDGSEKARIDSSGRLGIGTTSPNTKLDVRDSSATGISSRSTLTQATDTNKGLRVRNNSDTDTFSVSYRGEVYSAGRIGIGESDPDVTLHLKSSQPRIHLEDTGTNAVFRINADSSVGNAALDVDINSATSSPSLIVNIKGSEKMRLTSDGNLGIGVSDPSAKLEVVATSNDGIHAHIGGTKNSDGSNATRRTELGTTNFRSYIQGQYVSGGSFIAQEFLINPFGANVGIGLTNPDFTLDVDGSIRSQGVAPNISMLDTNADANNKQWDFKLTGSNTFTIQALNDSGAGGGNLFEMTRSSNSIQAFNGKKSGAIWFTVDNNARMLTTRSLTVSVDAQVSGRIVVANNSATYPSYSFTNSNNMGFYRHSANQIGVSTSGTARYRFTQDHFSPLLSSIDLGRNTSTHRFDNVFCVDLTESSDKNEKNTIVTSDLGLDFINKLNPVSYKRNDGESGRTHYGLIAQEIETVISEIGKTTKDFAGFVKTTHTEDAEGNTVDPYDCYALRYTQFISPIIKAIQELSTKVAALESA